MTAPRVFGSVAALAVGTLFVLYVRTGDHVSRAAWQEHLATVAAERTRLIDTWMRERVMDTRVLAASPTVREAVLAADDTSSTAVAMLRQYLERICATYGYAEVALLAPDGRLVASCSGRAPNAATVLWALRPTLGDAPLVETLDFGPEAIALRFALPVVPAPRSGRTVAGGETTGAVVLTTGPLMSVDEILLPRIDGTRTGRITLSAAPPDLDGDPSEVRAVHPVLGGARFLVATIATEEALASARAAALSQGLIAVGAILLPLLLAAIGWQRERTKGLRAALHQQRELLEARAYADAIVQSIDAVVWEAEVREAGDGGPRHDLDRWRFSFVSKRVGSILGHPTDSWLGCGNLWGDHVVPEDRDRVARFYTDVAASQAQSGSVEFRAYRADGSEVWLRDRVLAVTVDGLVRRIRGVLVDVTKRVRAEQDTAALLAVARDVGGSVDRREILARVQQRTAEVLPCDRVITFLLDPERDVLRVVAHHGLRPERMAAVEALEFRPGQPLGGLVLAGETVVVNDVTEQHWLPAAFYESLGVTALVAAPLHLRGHPSGGLVAVATAPNRAPFEQRQVTLLEGIARQLAVGLEVAEYHEGQAEEAIVSSALARVGRELITVQPAPAELLLQLCRLTVEVLGCDVSHTLLQKPGEETLTVVASHGVSPEERAALAAVRLPRDVAAPLLEQLTDQPLVQLDARRGDGSAADRLRAALGVETLLCVPLRRAGRPVGIQCAGDRQPRAFSARQLRIARGLAEIASTVFDRVQLVAELERASRVRSDFIATMSHELRTPLHIITGYQEMLLDGAFGALTAEQRDTVVRCQRNAGTLLELVNATLDLARLDAENAPPARAPVDIAAIVDTAVGDLADLARKPDVSLVVEHPDLLPALSTDPVKLKVIVKNLVGNAIKFTDRGTVTVRTSAADHGLVVTVSDSGIGIPADALAFIFEPFRQVDASNTRRHGGVGLGLHIVQRLAATLGGSISVTSDVDRGSTFRLWLPDDAGLKDRAA